jgi:ABC-type transport system substrate-binding protein
LRLLATVDLAPAPPTKGLDKAKGIYSGGYQLVAISSERRYELIPNPEAPARGASAPLTFVVSRGGMPSIDGFLNGTYDVTSNTAFPLCRLREWCATRAFRSGETGITMQIEINPTGHRWLSNQMARQMLFLALDRACIAKALSGGLRVADHFGPGCWPELRELSLPQPDRDHAVWLLKEVGRPVEPLRIYYNDYHPNREVIEAVAAQWRDVLGIRTELVTIDFKDTGRTDFDLILALRYPTIPSAWSTLEHFVLLSGLLGARNAGEQARVLSAWTEGGCETPLPLKTFRALFLDSFPVVPLFQIIGHWLERLGLRFPYPQDGYFVYSDMRGSDA